MPSGLGYTGVIYDIVIYDKDSIITLSGNFVNRIQYYIFRSRDISDASGWYYEPGITLYYYYEKIGSDWGLLLHPHFTSTAGGAFYSNYCTSDPQITSPGNTDYCDTICDNAQNLVYSFGLKNWQKNNTLIIFPNPSSTNLTINSCDKIQSFRIYDITGRTLTQYLINNTTSTIGVSQFNAGAYFIEIVTEKGKSVEKLVKE